MCMEIAQQSRSGSCVLTCVPPSCQVVSTGGVGTQPLYLYTYAYASHHMMLVLLCVLKNYQVCI